MNDHPFYKLMQLISFSKIYLRLSNRPKLRAREPVSFWQENEIAVVILLRVFVRTA